MNKSYAYIYNTDGEVFLKECLIKCTYISIISIRISFIGQVCVYIQGIGLQGFHHFPMSSTKQSFIIIIIAYNFIFQDLILANS